MLILSIWALLLLSMLAIAVGTHVSANLDMTTVLAQRVTCSSAARAGVMAAIVTVSGDTNEWDAAGEAWQERTDRFKDVEVGSGKFRVVHEEFLAGGLVVTNYGVADEERKININCVTNSAGFELVRSLLQIAGGLDQSDALAIATCLADWIDEDDEARTGGAESSYYSDLAGYNCRNARVQFPEEMLLVKGMNSKLFSGIRKHVTTHGGNASVNFNTAGFTVLVSACGARRGGSVEVCEALAQRILEFRQAGGVFEESRKRLVKAQLFGSGSLAGRGKDEWHALEWSMNHGLFAVRSRHFGGTAIGALRLGKGSERRIAFVYDRREDAIRAWNEK